MPGVAVKNVIMKKVIKWEQNVALIIFQKRFAKKDK
jgi:hypothetical protein